MARDGAQRVDQPTVRIALIREMVALRAGRKSHAERRPDVVALTRKLARYPVNGRKRSLRDVAAELEAQGHLNERGKRYAATAISRMLAS